MYFLYAPFTHLKSMSSNVQSPTVAPSSSEMCADTPGWRDTDGDGCEWYQEFDDPGCPLEGNNYAGEMGSAAKNCCYCKDPPVSLIHGFVWKRLASIQLNISSYF